MADAHGTTIASETAMAMASARIDTLSFRFAFSIAFRCAGLPETPAGLQVLLDGSLH